MYHKWQSYDVWFLRYEVWQSFLSFWAIFCPFTPQQPKKSKLKKKKKDKNSWRYHHFTKMYQKSSSYATLFLRYGTWWINCYFSFEATFCPSTPPPPHPPPPAAYKIKMLEDIISLYKCTKIMIICCTVPEIWQVTNVIIFYFGLLFVLLPPPPPLTVEKIKIYEKWKSCQEISQFYRCVSKIIIRWLQICLVHASHPPLSWKQIITDI